MRGVPFSIALLCLGCASSAFGQAELQTLQDELDSNAPPPGAALPQDPTADELEPPPFVSDPAVPELSEDEIAFAPDEPLAAGVSLGVAAGWGLTNQAPNPWAFGVGIQGGYTADNNLHVGAKFIFFLGQVTSNIFDFGLEGGYSIALGPMRFIPTLGLGIAFLTEATQSKPLMYLAPGAYLRVELDGFYFGVDMRGQFIIVDPVRMGIIPMLNIGLHY